MNRFKTYEIMEREKAEEMQIPPVILEISALFEKAGKKIYVVGGAVRDFLQNRTPKDFDLATDAKPLETIFILQDHFKLLDIGKAFGVIVVCPTDHKEDQIEIATFRVDSYRDSDFQEFVQYIERTKPENYIARLNELRKNLRNPDSDKENEAKARGVC